MALYDDGGIGFAEEKFAESRKRNEEIAKEQEKFSKNLLGVEAVVKGASYLINQRADTLQEAQVPQRARYENFLQNHEQIQKNLAPYIAQGGNKLEYLTNYYHDIYKVEAASVKPNLAVDSYDGWLRDQAGVKAKNMLPVFEKMQTESQDVPTFKEFIDDYEKYSKNTAPRSIAGATSKFVKNLFSKETPETLKYKNGKAQNALYGTPVFKEITELESAVKDFQAEGNGIADLVVELNKKAKAGDFKFKTVGAPTLTKVPVQVHGGTITKQYMTGFRKADNDIGFMPYSIEIENLSEFKSAPVKEYTKAERELAWGSVTDTVSRKDKKSIEVVEYNRILKKGTNLAFAGQVAEASESLIKMGYKPEEAKQRASLFLLQQSSANTQQGVSTPLRTTMTQFDAILQTENLDLEKDILNNVATFRDDALKKLGQDVNYFTNMHSVVKNYIDEDEEFTIDRKNELIRDLNKNLGFPPDTGLLQTKGQEEETDGTLPPKVITEPLNIEKVSSKYKINKDIIDQVLSFEDFKGNLQMSSKLGQPKILDLINTEMLINSGYIVSPTQTNPYTTSPINIGIAKRKFLKDLHSDIKGKFE